jgi:hypothetical protein
VCHVCEYHRGTVVMNTSLVCWREEIGIIHLEDFLLTRPRAVDSENDEPSRP